MQLHHLHTKKLGRHFLYFDSLGSTNDYLKEHAAQLPDGTAVVAAEQTAGKGRLGRSWKMRPGDTLAISILFCSVPMESTNIMPVLCGIAAARAVSGLCGKQALIKWPNDLILEDKKITGILCESRLLGKTGFLVCGIGVNTHATKEYFEQCGLPYAGSIQMCTGVSVSHEDLACRILEELEILYEQFCADSFAPIREEYASLCINLGREVRVVYQEHEVVGKAIAILEDGSLQVETEQGILSVSSGEASVRGLYGYV